MHDDDLSDLTLRPKPEEAYTRAKDYIVAAMYRMYQMGPDNRPCTLKEVADYYHTTVQNVHGLFRTRGYEIRSKNHVIHKRKSKGDLKPRITIIQEVTIQKSRKLELLPSPSELAEIIRIEEEKGGNHNTTERGEGASNVVQYNHERSI